MKEILKNFQKKLTNLNANNKSLLALRAFESDIDLHRFDFALNAPSFSIIDNLLSAKSSIPLCSYADARNEASNNLSKSLKKVQRIDQLIFDEQGTKDLCVGWPMVQGMLGSGQSIRCPLLFFPVSLSYTANTWILSLKQEDDITFNKSFLLAYSVHQGTPLAQELYDYVFDQDVADSMIFRTQLYELLKASNVELNFTQELFQDKLHSFNNYTRKDFESACQLGILKLVSSAVLGQYPQGGNFMTHDYDYMLDHDVGDTMERFFESKNTFDAHAHPISEDKICAPLSLDAWQEDALKAIKSGNSIVVQGPPGTGKSQLICNMVGDYIARGKTVVVVSQKRAALEVVFKRLEGLQLGSFVGVIHDYKNDRRKIFAQLSAQIEGMNAYKAENSSLDAIVLEREYAFCNKRIQDITLQLQQYKNALFDTTIFGKSIKELYLTTSSLRLYDIDFTRWFKFFTHDRLVESAHRLDVVFQYRKLLSPFQPLMQSRLDFSHFESADADNINRLLVEMVPHFRNLVSPLEVLCNQPISLSLFRSWIDATKDMESVLAWLVNPKNISLVSHIDVHRSHADWLAEQRQLLNDICHHPSYKLSKYSLSALSEQLIRVEKGCTIFSQPIKSFFWKYFSSDYTWLKRLLIENGYPVTPAGCKAYREALLQHAEHNKTIDLLSSRLWQLTSPLNEECLNEYFETYEQGLAVWDTLKVLPFLYDRQSLAREKLVEILRQFQLLKNVWISYEAVSSRYFTSPQLESLMADPEYAASYVKLIDLHFDTIVLHDRTLEGLIIQEKGVLDCLSSASVGVQPVGLTTLFTQRTQQHWIEYLETLFPILKSVSNGQMELWEEDLQNFMSKKQELSAQIIRLRVKEHTYQGLQYNRLNNRITYRDLKYQVGKKKNVWSLRQAFQSFPEEISKLIPCWLVSPSAVSAVFPIEDQIDLVIFDEASQCHAEQGFPAMYRARQLVVAGDAKQLQPSDLYQIRWEGEEEDSPDVAMDSLLTLAERYLQPHLLRGHYRSKYPELIDFSNQYFYNGKLNFLPHYEAYVGNEKSMEFHKVDGTWGNGINLIEATAAVEYALNLLKQSPEKSLGIICFNFPQAQLIQDIVLELQVVNLSYTKGPDFIKNIENVQGDECDIVLLSTGYAPDKDGKMSAQFGSLNLAGGEQRLNVAITRAREKVVVFSSLWPDQLKVTHTQNEGPKLFKKYLEYVLSISQSKNKIPVVLDSLPSPSWLLHERISEDLRQRNVQSFQHHFSDVLVMDQDNNASLIFTDDEHYAAANNIKEYHAYKLMVAKDKGWEYKKFASRNYFRSIQSP